MVGQVSATTKKTLSMLGVDDWSGRERGILIGLLARFVVDCGFDNRHPEPTSENIGEFEAEFAVMGLKFVRNHPEICGRVEGETRKILDDLIAKIGAQ